MNFISLKHELERLTKNRDPNTSHIESQLSDIFIEGLPRKEITDESDIDSYAEWIRPQMPKIYQCRGIYFRDYNEADKYSRFWSQVNYLALIIPIEIRPGESQTSGLTSRAIVNIFVNGWYRPNMTEMIEMTELLLNF